MSIQPNTVGRPILFGGAVAPVSGLTRREHIAGRPILFGNAVLPPGLTRRTESTTQSSSPFRTFPFSHPPALSSRSNEQDFLSSVATLPTCDYKPGFSASSDPAIICPYAAKLQSSCMGDSTPAELKEMTLSEIAEVGKECAKVICAEIKAGTYLEKVTECFNAACEENKEAVELIGKAVKVMEKTGCNALGLAGTTTAKTATTSTAAAGFKTSTTAAAAAATETTTGEVEESATSANKTESLNGAVKSPIQEDSSAERIVWKSGVLVGALIFGSLFSSMV